MTGGLTMKINLNSVKKAEEKAKKARQRKPAPMRPKKPKERKFGLKEEFKGGNLSDEGSQELLPARELSSRKAKDVKAKYVVDSDSDSDTLKPIRKPGEESASEHYDSDDDPAWTPAFDGDTKKTNTLDLSLEGKRKRSKGKPK
ncbi:hypothetical protein MAR_008406, partial [Mya arenaria]